MLGLLQVCFWVLLVGVVESLGASSVDFDGDAEHAGGWNYSNISYCHNNI